MGVRPHLLQQSHLHVARSVQCAVGRCLTSGGPAGHTLCGPCRVGSCASCVKFSGVPSVAPCSHRFSMPLPALRTPNPPHVACVLKSVPPPSSPCCCPLPLPACPAPFPIVTAALQGVPSVQPLPHPFSTVINHWPSSPSSSTPHVTSTTLQCDLHSPQCHLRIVGSDDADGLCGDACVDECVHMSHHSLGTGRDRVSQG